jgi:hypothetical protein
VRLATLEADNEGQLTGGNGDPYNGVRPWDWTDRSGYN